MKISFAKATTDRTSRRRDPVFGYLYDAPGKRILTVHSVEKLTPVRETIETRSKHIPLTYLTDERTFL